ncbi:zinc ribbon domain-containing protein [Acinetobacter bereziniae]|uniref:zinc ribbon domain-containing protein n=1 Tax=Acinetobacter bereziniae TaxID=106648 RepID=UPI003009170E
MALKNCKECGNQVSDKADNCPKCGAKVKKVLPKWVVWSVFIILFLIILGSCQEKNENNNSAQKQENNNLTADAKDQVVESNWTNSQTNDEMRGTKTNTTTNVSKNTVNFAFPYNGGSNLFLSVRNKSGEKDVIIRISKGLFVCGIIDGCQVNFKFDDGSIQSITMVGTESHDTDVLFVRNTKTANSIIQKIKTSKKLIIEPNFFQEGSKQFNFDLDGFENP